MISIVIPTFNSEKSIGKLCETIIDELDMEFEIILINDASTDNTREILKNLKLSYNFIRVVNLTNNVGQVGATLAGINISKGEFIITMDDDLQHHPRFINDLYTSIQKEDVDIIVAKWKQDETFTRNVSSYIFSVFTSILILSSIDFRNTAFRIMKKEIKSEFTNYFMSRFWIDPRRLKVKVSQINVGHELQNFRPYSSLKTRVLLATKHFILDTFLVQILILSIGFRRIFLSVCLALLFYILQKYIKHTVKIRRINHITFGN